MKNKFFAIILLAAALLPANILFAQEKDDSKADIKADSVKTEQSEKEILEKDTKKIADSEKASAENSRQEKEIRERSETEHSVAGKGTAEKNTRSIPKAKKKKTISRTPLSGLVLMPTAYKSTGINELGPALDINAAYIIGRLYGRNDYDWTMENKDYLDRIGLWLLSAEGKLLVQTEGKFRPALAAGVQGIYTLRDSSNPTLKTNQDLKVDAKSTNGYANIFVSASKRLGKKFIINAGYSDGDMPKMMNSFSEYLSVQAMSQNGITGTRDATGMIFGGFMWLPKPDSPISVELMVPQGSPMHPKLVNLHLGTMLKLNFEISYLKFKGGWDLLGIFQFRYNYWP